MMMKSLMEVLFRSNYSLKFHFSIFVMLFSLAVSMFSILAFAQCSNWAYPGWSNKAEITIDNSENPNTLTPEFKITLSECY